MELKNQYSRRKRVLKYKKYILKKKSNIKKCSKISNPKSYFKKRIP